MVWCDDENDPPAHVRAFCTRRLPFSYAQAKLCEKERGIVLSYRDEVREKGDRSELMPLQAQDGKRQWI